MDCQMSLTTLHQPRLKVCLGLAPCNMLNQMASSKANFAGNSNSPLLFSQPTFQLFLTTQPITLQLFRQPFLSTQPNIQQHARLQHWLTVWLGMDWYVHIDKSLLFNEDNRIHYLTISLCVCILSSCGSAWMEVIKSSPASPFRGTLTPQNAVLLVLTISIILI